MKQRPKDEPGPRPCLRCGKPFASGGFAERICPHCKGLKQWRDASPAREGVLPQVQATRPAGHRTARRMT